MTSYIIIADVGTILYMLPIFSFLDSMNIAPSLPNNHVCVVFTLTLMFSFLIVSSVLVIRSMIVRVLSSSVWSVVSSDVELMFRLFIILFSDIFEFLCIGCTMVSFDI